MAETMIEAESPIGVAFLHRLVLAAHFVMTTVGPCGIRLVCLLLNLTGIDQFVAASYGSRQRVSAAMEEVIVEYGDEEKARLASGMEPREITICEDENFHQAPCLVGMEPVSNFILLEKYASDRTAEQWTACVTEATKGMKLKVIQSTSNEGKGILRHTREHLGAHHSPGLFHVQHELVKVTSAALENRKKQAQREVEEAKKELNRKQESLLQNWRGNGSVLVISRAKQSVLRPGTGFPGRASQALTNLPIFWTYLSRRHAVAMVFSGIFQVASLIK